MGTGVATGRFRAAECASEGFALYWRDGLHYAPVAIMGYHAGPASAIRTAHLRNAPVGRSVSTRPRAATLVEVSQHVAAARHPEGASVSISGAPLQAETKGSNGTWFNHTSAFSGAESGADGLDSVHGR